MKTFVKNLIKQLDIRKDGVYVALVIFSNEAEIKIPFPSTNEIQTYETIERAIDNIQYMGGETFTSLAMSQYLDNLHQQSNGNR